MDHSKVSQPLKLKRLKGVSLIEVLVALLLVSVSGFGVLAMSSFATQESNSLRFEVNADYLGRSLISRIQTNANDDNRALYAFENQTVPALVIECNTGCGAAQIAQADIAEWSAEANAKLPNARYKSWWDKNQLYVGIAWTGPTLNNAATLCPFETTDQEACRVYVAYISKFSLALAYQNQQADTAN